VSRSLCECSRRIRHTYEGYLLCFRKFADYSYVCVQGTEFAYLSSRSNLQALRDIDARGVSFLKAGGASGESFSDRQPWGGERGGDGVPRTGGEILPLKRKGESCVKQSCNRAGPAEPLTSQIGFNVA